MALNLDKTTGELASVNNAGRDPIQGFDCKVWVQDQATGFPVLLGNFTSIQLTVRNSTEPYLEFGQRVARMLDGEFQFGWVMEKGSLDIITLAETFGFSQITRDLQVSRSPRFSITFDVSAPELDEVNSKITRNKGNTNNSLNDILHNPYKTAASGAYKRRASGQIQLHFCKIDTYTMGAMAGQKVVANRWEGLAEGYFLNDSTKQDSKTTLMESVDNSSNGAKNSTSLFNINNYNSGSNSVPRTVADQTNANGNVA